MSPEQIADLGDRWPEALARLGWTRREVEIPHVRDSAYIRKDAILLGPDGKGLAAEGDLYPTMVDELIRIAEKLGDQADLLDTAEVHRDWKGNPYLVTPERDDR